MRRASRQEHGKLIWPQEHQRHLGQSNELADLLAAVIRGVIYEKNRPLSLHAESSLSSWAISLARKKQKVLDLVLPRFTVKYILPSEVMAAIIFTENSLCEYEANVRLP